MNFLDPYAEAAADAQPAGGSTEGPQDNDPPSNPDVNQVIGHIGRLWGGFRKQSQLAFDSAKKDLSQVVTQAQREISLLANDIPFASSSTTTTSSTEEEPPSDAPPPSSEDSSEGSASATVSQTSPISSIFSRIQSSLPPSITSTIQGNLPSGGQVNMPVDLTQLRTTISSELSRVQDLTFAQAGDYVQKSEVFLKEAGAFLKDAVKVIPPEEGDAGTSSNLIWSGTDVWEVPSGPISSKRKGKERDDAASSRTIVRGHGSRVDASLHRLKGDAEQIKADPMEEEILKDLFESWKQDLVSTVDSGILGGTWAAKAVKALSDERDGELLKTTKASLVPGLMDEETFWTRYFFRVYQIEQEEEKRKALLAGASELDEDFSWEDEDEETAPTPLIVSTPSLADDVDLTNTLKLPRVSSETISPRPRVKTTMAVPSRSPIAATPSDTSPRLSSEDGYDVVSTVSSVIPESNTSAKGKGDDDADSDWE